MWNKYQYLLFIKSIYCDGTFSEPATMRSTISVWPAEHMSLFVDLRMYIAEPDRIKFFSVENSLLITNLWTEFSEMGAEFEFFSNWSSKGVENVDLEHKINVFVGLCPIQLVFDHGFEFNIKF